jgi:hypothetical protein
MPQLGNCRSCGAELIWVRTAATGTLMPLDAKPAEDGNTVIKDGVAHVLKGDLFEEFLDGPKHKSHFATCPAASAWRRKQ